MDQVRVFLRSPLFSPGSSGHVPANAVILDATVSDRPSGGVLLAVTGYADDQDRPVEGAPCSLFIPFSKIDHMLVVAS